MPVNFNSKIYFCQNQEYAYKTGSVPDSAAALLPWGVGSNNNWGKKKKNYRIRIHMGKIIRFEIYVKDPNLFLRWT